MADKLSVINAALKLSGNEPVTTNDGSPGWEVASEAYDTELPLLIARRDWGFASTVVPLVAAGSNPSQAFAYAYQRPAQALQVMDVYEQGIPLVAYEMVDNLICCDAPTSVSAKILRLPAEAAWTVGFAEVLKLKVMAGIYRGLHEDPDEANKRDAYAERVLDEVAARVAQERKGRALMVSRIAERRRGGGQPR